MPGDTHLARELPIDIPLSKPMLPLDLPLPSYYDCKSPFSGKHSVTLKEKELVTYRPWIYQVHPKAQQGQSRERMRWGFPGSLFIGEFQT